MYEFYQNSPPVEGTMDVTVANNIGLGSGTAMESIYSVQLNDFDDNRLHNELPTMYKLYMKSNSKYHTITS